MPAMMLGGAPVSGMGPSQSATYGRAKEQTGLETQAALKQLRELMAFHGRGGGSGVQAHEERQLLQGGLGDLAETDRQMAEAGASRDFQARESGKNREFSAAESGLRSAMSAPETAMGDPSDPYGTKAAARMQAIFEAKRQLQALTGYSAGAGVY